MDLKQASQKIRNEIEQNDEPLINHLIFYLPKDNYNLEIDDVLLATRDKEPYLTYICIKMHIKGGPYSGFMVWDTFSVEESSVLNSVRRIEALVRLLGYELDDSDYETPKVLVDKLKEMITKDTIYAQVSKSRMGNRAQIQYLPNTGVGYDDIPDIEDTSEIKSMDEVPF